jgi:hypothetical protein
VKRSGLKVSITSTAASCATVEEISATSASRKSTPFKLIIIFSRDSATSQSSAFASLIVLKDDNAPPLSELAGCA